MLLLLLASGSIGIMVGVRHSVLRGYMSYLAVLTHHQLYCTVLYCTALYCTVLYCIMSYLAVLTNHQLTHRQHPGALPPQYHELAQVVNLTQPNISINNLFIT